MRNVERLSALPSVNHRSLTRHTLVLPCDRLLPRCPTLYLCMICSSVCLSHQCRYLVLPMRPEGTDGWTEEQLQGIITRDTMIGVAIPVVAEEGKPTGA